MTNNRNPYLKLKQYREYLGVSQKELAARTQTSQGYISEIEMNIKSPTIRMLYRFADALDICPRLLLPCIIEYRNENECELNLYEDSNI